jgi:endonuclease-3 related protein
MPQIKELKDILENFYQLLYLRFGPQHWWPAKSPFEVIVGAILTQNTNWTNVERSITNLRRAKLLSPRKLRRVNLKRLARLIRSSGYFNLKAKRLKNFTNFLFSRYDGSLNRMFNTDPWSLRAELLQVTGIGPETADSILLYAGEKPIFVIDTYTKRFLLRHNLIDADATYSQAQDIFLDNLQSDVVLFKEFHALIVRLAKEFCKTNAHCQSCPLEETMKDINYICDSCGADLKHPRQRYILKIQLYASPEVELTREDLKRNTQVELRRLLKQLETMDVRKIQEEVFVSYKLILCKKCRDTFNERIKHKEFV